MVTLLGKHIQKISHVIYYIEYSRSSVPTCINLSTILSHISSTQFNYYTLTISTINHRNQTAKKNYNIFTSNTLRISFQALEIMAALSISCCDKSFIACFIGTMACSQGKRWLYYCLPDLCTDFDCLKLAQQSRRFVSKLAKMELLILDEWFGIKLSYKHINLIF